MAIDWSDPSTRSKVIKRYEAAATNGESLDAVAKSLNLDIGALRHGLKVLKNDGSIKAYKSYRKSNLETVVDLPVEIREEGKLIDGTPYIKVVSSDPAKLEDVMLPSDDWGRFSISKCVRNLKRKTMKDSEGDLIEVKEWSQTVYFGLKDACAAIKEVQDHFIDQLNTDRVSTDHPVFKSDKARNKTAVVEIPDFHLGNLVWHQECVEDWDLEIAKELYTSVFKSLVDRAVAKADVKHIVLPFGNDFLHADNKEGTTTAGTQLDLDSRWVKVYKLGGDLQIWAIDYCRKQVPKVSVIYIPGNHDELTTFTLGDMIERVYSKDTSITVNNSPKLRKYMRIGCTLMGWTHGNQERKTNLPTLMLREAAKEDVAKCDFFEFHLGHWHHRKGDVLREDYIDITGVTIRTMPTLTPNDDWHTGKGLTLNTKAAEAYIYDEEEGLMEIIVAQRKMNLRKKK